LIKFKYKFIIQVFAFCGVFFALTPVYAAPQAALFLNPDSGTFLVGSTFNLSVVLDTKGNSVNTAEIEILFPSDKIQLASPSVGQSIVQLWSAPPSFSNKEGVVYFVGGIPSPGIITADGVVLTFTFRVIAPGDAEIKFGSRTSILANDGRGTDILGQKPSAFFKFLAPPPQGPAISSSSHPDQERWYKDNNPIFVWLGGAFANAFSYLIDRDPSGVPDTVSEGTASTASFNNLDNGIWYFHLRAGSDGTWGGVSSYAIKVDNLPPAAFTINVSPGKRTTNRSPIFRFFSTDSLSGFSHFEMKMIRLSGEKTFEGLFYEVSSPYQAVNIEPGRYQVVVRAYDNALNSRDESATINILGPFSKFIDLQGIDLIVFFLPWERIVNILLLILVLFLVMIFLLWREHQQHLKYVFIEDIKKTFSSVKNLWQEIKKLLNISVILIILGVLFTLSPFRAVRANELRAPEISVVPAQYYPLDEILYLGGRVEPVSKVQIQFQKQGAKPLKFNVKSDVNGEWVLAEKVPLMAGDWEVRVRLVEATKNNPEGRTSEWSNPRIFNVIVTGITIGGVNVKFAFLSFIIIFLLLLGIAAASYFILKVRRLKSDLVSKEIREARESVREGVSHIRNDLIEELRFFESSEKPLSEEQLLRKKHLVSELDRLEKEMEREISDIEHRSGSDA